MKITKKAIEAVMKDIYHEKSLINLLCKISFIITFYNNLVL